MNRLVIFFSAFITFSLIFIIGFGKILWALLDDESEESLNDSTSKNTANIWVLGVTEDIENRATNVHVGDAWSTGLAELETQIQNAEIHWQSNFDD